MGQKIKPIRRTRRDGDYTPAERRAIGRGIAQSEKEYQQGKNAGPFDTTEAFFADLHRESAKLDDSLTPAEAKRVRHGERQIKEGRIKLWSDVKHELSR